MIGVNETKWYDEKATYRAVTGAGFNFPLPDGTILYGGGSGSGEQFPNVGTIPIAKDYNTSELGNLTFTSKGVNVRVSGEAPPQIKPDDYIYDGNLHIRRIKSVMGTLIELWEAFPSDIGAATPLKICERQFFKSIRAKNTHASGAASLQNAPFKAGDEFENGGAPVVYSAGSGEISFTCSK